jgi:hypothetical protein
MTVTRDPETGWVKVWCSCGQRASGEFAEVLEWAERHLNTPKRVGAETQKSNPPRVSGETAPRARSVERLGRRRWGAAGRLHTRPRPGRAAVGVSQVARTRDRHCVVVLERTGGGVR